MLLGSLTTVLAAWLFAIFSPLGDYTITYTPPPPGSVLSSASRVPADFEKGTHVLRRGRGMRYELVTEMMWIGSRLGMMTDRANRSIERVEVGWPLPAMEWIGELDIRHDNANWSPRQGITPPFRADRLAQGAVRRLPLVPLWPGFALDTLLAAAIFWLAGVIVPAARRAIRRRRGRCPACNYDLRGAPTDRCPECGHRERRRRSSPHTLRNDRTCARPRGPRARSRCTRATEPCARATGPCARENVPPARARAA